MRIPLNLETLLRFFWHRKNYDVVSLELIADTEGLATEEGQKLTRELLERRYIRIVLPSGQTPAGYLITEEGLKAFEQMRTDAGW